jgi:hypothetical protein
MVAECWRTRNVPHYILYLNNTSFENIQNREKLKLGETGVSMLRVFSSQPSRTKLGTIDLTFNNHDRSPTAVFTKLHLRVLLLQK